MTNPSSPPIPTSIAGLPAAPQAISGGEFIAVVQNGVTVRTTIDQVGVAGPTGPQGPAGTVVPWAIAGGTADAIIASYTPPNGSLTDGLLLSFRASAANATTTPTFAPDGLIAHTITDDGGSALAAGAIPAATAECLVRYNSAHSRWELLNPAVSGGSSGVTTTGSPASGNLTKFSGASTITNADLTGDVTTAGGVATTLATVNATTGSFDFATITVNGKGLITAASAGAVASNTVFGVVKTDGSTIANTAGVISAATATSSQLGVVKPDGTIITVVSGAITVPNATSGSKGVVQVDGTSITASGGVISATSGLITALAVGSIIHSANNLAFPTTIAAGGTSSASFLAVVYSDASTGVWGLTGDVISGTWRALQTIATNTTQVGLWQRIA